jgi:lipopolysaccharide transport system ATP-binding protein
MEDSTIITLDNITKYYRLYPDRKSRLKEALNPFKKKYHHDFFALQNINLKVQKGEIFGIVGKNGSGKSTLLKIIAGVLTPSSGIRFVNGKISALLELGGGFNPDFTGMENIFFYGSVIGYTKSEMMKKIDEIIDFADIGEFISQPLRKYSSGMKARLGFSVAINVDPDILIIDEILAVGDELFRNKCFGKINQFLDAGKTILLVTHSVEWVNGLCTRTILLDKGELILEGPSKLVTLQYQRLLYSKPENAPNVKNEITKMNKDAEMKMKYLVDISKKEGASDKNEKSENIIEITNEKLISEINQKPYFIPDFIPKSTVHTTNYDVSISDIQIRTHDDKKVNILVMNEEYIYSFKVKFNMEAQDVKFGVGIKTEKSVKISGITIPSKTLPIKKISKGQEFVIDVPFKCNLLPGIYYTSTGVTSNASGEKKYLCLIDDALIFRVQKNQNNYWGTVHLNQYFNIKEITKQDSA